MAVEHRKVTKPTTIQSVERATKILLAVAAAPDGASAKEVSNQFNLSLPTAYHLLTTLVREGILSKDARRRYALGPLASVIADAVAGSLVAPQQYLDALTSLAASTRETAYLSAWRGGRVTILQSAEGVHAVRVAGLTRGYCDHLHARASGKLLLAYAPEYLRNSQLEQLKLTRLTSNTITTRRELVAEFARIINEGVAHDNGEFSEDVYCVSVPIIERGSVVACLTVSVPVGRYQSDSAMILARLQDAAEAARVTHS